MAHCFGVSHKQNIAFLMFFKQQTITAVVIRRGKASQILAIKTLQNNQQIAGIPLSIELQAYIEKEPIARGS